MKKLIAFVTVAAQMTTATAHVGGPWSMGTFDNNVSGTYSGIMTGNSLTGVFRFTQTDNAQLSVFNSSMIYFKGYTYLGSAQVNIDIVAKRFAGITNGTADARPGGGPNPLNDSVQRAPGNLATAVPTDIEGGTRTVTLGLDNGPVGVANSNFRGKLTTTHPTVRFKGRGEATFFGSLTQLVRLSAQNVIEDTRPLDPANANDAGSSDPNFVNSFDNQVDFTLDFGGNDPIVKPRNRTKILVYGGAISRTVSAPIVPQGSLAGSGGGAFSF